jgi:hypothetical protein
MANPNTILGTAVVTFPNDTTANRPGAAGGTRSSVTPTAGMMRFNETTTYMEYYDGTQWNAITVPPTISSISPTYFAAAADVITITGSNFQTGAIVSIVSKTGTVYTAETTTVVNGSTVTFPITTAMAADVNDPFDVRVVNLSGLTAIGTALLSRAVNPAFATATGSIGTIFDSGRSSYSLSPVTATNSESDVTINSYTITSGGLPTGLSINSTTGAITGTASAVGSDTTSTFTVTASGTDTSNPSQPQTISSSRSFSILVKAPVTTSFFSTGPATFSVPTGVTSVRVLAVAGGAGGGNAFNGSASGGGGGAGGVVVHSTFPVSPGGTVALSVGAGGAGGVVSPDAATGKGVNGSNTTFGGITALGGGGGGHYPEIGGDPNGIGNPGGSGGGGGGAGIPGIPGGTATQGPSGGGTGYGYGGGTCQGTGISNGSTSCGGGGGAGASGIPGVSNSRGGAGGSGYSWPVNSTTYAGGGGGGGAGVDRGGAGGSGGGGAGGNLPAPGAITGTAGTTNTGGGGGGASAGEGPSVNAPGAAGAPGIVIVNY